MSTLVSRGTFLTGTGIAGTTVAVTGLGQSPDAIILFYGGRTTNNTNAKGTPRRGVGFVARNGAGVDNCGAGTYDTDGGATTDTGGWDSTSRSVKRLTTGLVNGGEGHVSSLDADGFTFTVDIAFGSSILVEFLAIGGSDVSAVGIGNFQLPTSTGNFAVTGVGGKPDAMFFLGVRATGADTAYHDFSLSFGAASRFDGGQACWAGGADHGAATSATLSVGGRGQVYQLFNSNVSGNQSRGSFVSFDSDGCTLNALQGTVADRMFYLAITGPAFKIGGIDVPTDTTTTNKEDGIGFVPKGFLFVGHENGESTFTSPTGDDMWSMAAGISASDRSVMGTESFTGATGGDVVQGTYDGIFIDMANTPALEIRTDLTAVGRNDFSYKNITNTTANSGFVWYVAVGDAPGNVPISSRGNFVVQGGPSGTALASSQGRFSVVASEGIRGDASLKSTGQFSVVASEGVSGTPVPSSRGDIQVTGTFGLLGDVSISSRGDMTAASTPGALGDVSLSSRGDEVAAGGVGAGGAALISSRGQFFVSAGSALVADMFLSSRGDLVFDGSEGVPGDALVSSRGNFVVAGTVDVQNPFACRPGNIAREVRKAIMDRPTAWVRFRGRANRQ